MGLAFRLSVPTLFDAALSEAGISIDMAQVVIVKRIIAGITVLAVPQVKVRCLSCFTSN